MKTRLAFITALCLSGSALAQDAPSEPDILDQIAERDLREMKAVLPGLYTNAEQVYFQDDLDYPEDVRVPRLSLRIEPDGDGFKATTTSDTGRETEARLEYYVEDGRIRSREYRDGELDCERVFSREFESWRGEGCGGVVVASADGFMFGYPNRPFVMRRARPFTCWAAPRNEDGSYSMYSGLELHDQGGRVAIEATDTHPRVSLKLRNVRWPTKNQRHSLVLYTYQGDDDSYAPAYTWGDPTATRIALNARWLQVSCTAGETIIDPKINLKTGSGN